MLFIVAIQHKLTDKFPEIGSTSLSANVIMDYFLFRTGMCCSLVSQMLFLNVVSVTIKFP